MEKSGHITFGYFNHFTKLSAPFLQTVREVLLAVPDSRLRVLAPGDESLVGELFSRQGIDLSRIDLVRRCSPAEYLKLFAAVDLALGSVSFQWTYNHVRYPVDGRARRYAFPGKRMPGRMSTSVFEEP